MYILIVQREAIVEWAAVYVTGPFAILAANKIAKSLGFQSRFSESDDLDKNDYVLTKGDLKISILKQGDWKWE